MTQTQLRGNQFLDGTVQRADLDVTTAASAVIRKAIAGAGVTLTSTGVDAGTGDVTISTNITATITASESLSAGAWVNVWNSSGSFRVRNADATASGKEADGYVLSSVSSSGSALVYFSGVNTAVSSMTPGLVFLQTTAGTGGTTVPSTTGNVVQILGVAVSATAVVFQTVQPPVTLA